MQKHAKNAAIELIENLRKEGAYYNVQEIFIGKVISKSPLKIKFSDIEVKGDTFFKTRKFLELFDEKCTAKDCNCIHRRIETGDDVLIVYSKEIEKYILVDKIYK